LRADYPALHVQFAHINQRLFSLRAAALLWPIEIDDYPHDDGERRSVLRDMCELARSRRSFGTVDPAKSFGITCFELFYAARVVDSRLFLPAFGLALNRQRKTSERHWICIRS
jgi:hypothetical protein